MEIKPTIIPASEITMKHLEELAQQLFQQQIIKTEDLLKFESPNAGLIKTIDLKPLEFHEGSIVTQGFTLDGQWKPAHIVFRTKHNRRKVKVIDALITPEMAVLYVDKDTRNWPYTKGCELCCDRQPFYTGDGIISKIKKSFSSPQGTIYFQHCPLLYDL